MSDHGHSDFDSEDPGHIFLSPYELWNFGVGKPYAFPGIRKWTNYITAMAEFPRPQAFKPDTNVDAIAAATGLKLWVPTLWKPDHLTFFPFVAERPIDFTDTPQGLRELLEKVSEQLMPTIHTMGLETRPMGLGARRIDIAAARFRVAFPVPDPAMHDGLVVRPVDPQPEPEDLGVADGRHITVVAVIDDGLPFAHRNFRDPGGRTRVEYCWLQSIRAEEGQDTVLFGREYTRRQIDRLIDDHGDDEDRLYRAAGATLDTEELGSLLDRHATHGAHVMDLATGYADERQDMAPKEVRIIAVQLPNTIAWDTSGFGKDMYMLSAFHYIFNRADIIARTYGVSKLRLVVNFSYGFSGGRHDGGMQLEAAIDELVQKRRREVGPTALVLPAGNTFQERMHGRIPPSPPASEFKINWRLQPNSRTPSYLELWFGTTFDPAGCSIEIRDPWDNCVYASPIEVRRPTGVGDPIASDVLRGEEAAPIGQFSIDKHRGERWRMMVVLAPTEPDNPALPRATSGAWTIKIKLGEHGPPLEEPIQCWIQRAADPAALGSGSRQSYFEDPDYISMRPSGDISEADADAAFIRRFGSLNGMATGGTSLIVAGYRLAGGHGSGLEHARPARYSSAGEIASTSPGQRVDCSSMSDRSEVLAGTAAAGVRSGSRSVLRGTSAAAPFVARQLAEAFVIADDATVRQAEAENYRSLLVGYRQTSDEPGTNADMDSCTMDSCTNDDELGRARLGSVRVPPHWQPGIEPGVGVQEAAPTPLG